MFFYDSDCCIASFPKVRRFLIALFRLQKKSQKNIQIYLHIEHMFITFAAYLKQSASSSTLKKQLKKIIS